MKFFNKRNKKGFMLADALIAIVASSMFCLTITGLIILSNKITNHQFNNVEYMNIAYSLLEEIQSGEKILDENNVGDIIKNDTPTETNTPTNPDLDTNNKVLETQIKGNLNTYKATVFIEKDTNLPNFEIITIKVEWFDKYGSPKNYEIKGFKVDELS